ncbi:MAG: rod shape-determining protein MreC [Aestuariivita sp.]|nr:rod shape-determining protein MreC [Aestuariivita sp.]
MAKYRSEKDQFTKPLKRLLTGLILLFLLGFFLIWRIDNPRVERLRTEIFDQIFPTIEWLMMPTANLLDLLENFQSYQNLAEQNQELRSELRQMNLWKEAALQLEQENARLLDLNNVQLDPRLTYITGVVLADSGSPFRQSVLLNVGARDGVLDGWAAMDGIGLVGRIANVGDNTSRVLLLTDTTSLVPAKIHPSGQTTLVTGDHSSAPVLQFIENNKLVKPGDRVITSGDGSVFPAGLLIGQVATDTSDRLRVRLSADFERLKFLRLMRHKPKEQLKDTKQLIVPKPSSRNQTNARTYD